jgi:2-oxoglutarate ferredoxin oxidoreductase subunit gamma
MREDIVFAGFGGQGIMLMGKLLSYAAMNEGKSVTWMPSYGAEVRGGTAHSMVIVADGLIASPVVKKPSICVVMNKPSFQKFETKITPKGLLIINGSLVESGTERKDIEVLKIPATRMAEDLGNLRVANMIILGALLARKKFISMESLMNCLENVIPENHRNLIPVNEKAIKEGYEYGSC